MANKLRSAVAFAFLVCGLTTAHAADPVFCKQYARAALNQAVANARLQEVNARPDLARVAVLDVPFVDVVNTMLDASLPLTTAEYIEWGNPNVAEEYQWIRAYSPYDNIRAQAYPAILVTTALNDSQVPYWEGCKFVAKLRALKTDTNPLLLKVNLDPAGHGGSSGRYDALHEVAFDYAFILTELQ